MSFIEKKEIEHLAKLARLELKATEEEKIAHDLGRILAHFEELKSVDTEATPPMSGGTSLKNVMREDEHGREALSGDRLQEQFPDAEKGMLKVPHVFTTSRETPRDKS